MSGFGGRGLELLGLMGLRVQGLGFYGLGSRVLWFQGSGLFFLRVSCLWSMFGLGIRTDRTQRVASRSSRTAKRC